MSDALIPYVGPDGKHTLESATQLIGRILIPLGGDGAVTLLQALADRPTQADVAAAIASLQIVGGDFDLLRQAVADAASAAGQAQTAASGKASLGGLIGPDRDWPIPSDAVHVVIPALTTSRTWSLPDVDGYPRGQDLVIVDEGRFLGAGPSLTLIPLAGSGDAIAGYPSGILLADAGASVRLRRGLLSDVWVVV